MLMYFENTISDVFGIIMSMTQNTELTSWATCGRYRWPPITLNKVRNQITPVPFFFFFLLHHSILNIHVAINTLPTCQLPPPAKPTPQFKGERGNAKPLQHGVDYKIVINGSDLDGGGGPPQKLSWDYMQDALARGGTWVWIKAQHWHGNLYQFCTCCVCTAVQYGPSWGH